MLIKKFEYNYYVEKSFFREFFVIFNIFFRVFNCIIVVPRTITTFNIISLRFYSGVSEIRTFVCIVFYSVLVQYVTYQS